MLQSEIIAALRWWTELELTAIAWKFRPADRRESPEEYCEALAEHIARELGYETCMTEP